ncbi:MAG: dihydroorotate dehydrogenase electron transfer subunit [Thermoplasmata archaeon]
MMHSTIDRVDDEAPGVKTFYFRWPCKVTPGQFIMVWLPGFGEVPMSLSSVSEEKSFTIKAYGEVTRRITELKAGERIFFRGPYGRGFTLKAGKKLLIGGGSGMASLITLKDDETYALISAKTKRELIFTDRFDSNHLYIATDDGSEGIRGYPVDALKTMDLSVFSAIYVCGPEMMIKSVFDYLKDFKIYTEFSLERLMKCGIGVCDSCSIGGYQVCKDGPVFNGEELRSNPEFGKTRLTYSGKRIQL